MENLNGQMDHPMLDILKKVSCQEKEDLHMKMEDIMKVNGWKI